MSNNKKDGSLQEQDLQDLISGYDDDETPIARYKKSLEFCRRVLKIKLVLVSTGDKNLVSHDIYIPAAVQPIKGLNIPNGFKIMRLANIDDFSLIQDRFKRQVNSNEGSIGECKERAKFLKLLSPILFRTTRNNKTSEIDIITNQLRALNSRVYQNIITRTFELGIEVIDPKPIKYDPNKEADYPIAYIPPKKWFDEKLHNVRQEDIMTLLNGAELRVFNLAIGRACAGRSNNIQAISREVITHTYRSFPILMGRTAGTGKSRFCDFLLDALKRVGYNVYTFVDLGGEFNQGRPVSAHIAYCDDLNEDTFKALVNSKIFKPAITGGRFPCRDLYENSQEIDAHALFLANINKFNINVTYEFDDGVLARIDILDTHWDNNFEAEKRKVGGVSLDSPDFRPFIHLPWLANKLGVSIDCLMLWYCRLCVDDFLNVVKSGNLEKEMKSLKLQLKEQLHQDFEKVIAMMFQLSYLCFQKRDQEPYIPEINPVHLIDSVITCEFLVNDVRANPIREVIKKDYKDRGKNSLHPWTAIKLIDQYSLVEARQAIINSSESFLRSSIKKTVKLIYSELRLDNAYEIAANVAAVKSAWRDSKIQATILYDIAEKIKKDPSCGEALILIRNGPKTDDRHLYSEGYDRQRFVESLKKGNK